jgi:Ran GTPase-activating protein (RanGAP) involved in mRNA processing and transport
MRVVQGLAVAHALFENRSLRRLNVKNNALTPMVAYCLLSGVRHHKRIEYLDLSGNNLGLEGGRQLMGLVLDSVGRLNIVFE